MVTEAAAKNAREPRKGSVVYILKDGDTKAVKATVTDTRKIKDRKWDTTGKSYTTYVTLGANDYDLADYSTFTFGTIDYTDKDMVITIKSNDEKYYIGISAEAIKEFINSGLTKELSTVLAKIGKLEDDLAKLYQERDELENKINTEITESLQNGKQNI